MCRGDIGGVGRLLEAELEKLDRAGVHLVLRHRVGTQRGLLDHRLAFGVLTHRLAGDLVGAGGDDGKRLSSRPDLR